MSARKRFLKCVERYNKREIYREFGTVVAPSMYEITKLIYENKN